MHDVAAGRKHDVRGRRPLLAQHPERAAGIGPVGVDAPDRRHRSRWEGPCRTLRSSASTAWFAVGGGRPPRAEPQRRDAGGAVIGGARPAGGKAGAVQVLTAGRD